MRKPKQDVLKWFAPNHTGSYSIKAKIKMQVPTFLVWNVLKVLNTKTRSLSSRHPMWSTFLMPHARRSQPLGCPYRTTWKQSTYNMGHTLNFLLLKFTRASSFCDKIGFKIYSINNTNIILTSKDTLRTLFQCLKIVLYKINT